MRGEERAPDSLRESIDDGAAETGREVGENLPPAGVSELERLVPLFGDGGN